MPVENPIPLDRKVRVKEDKIPELVKKLKDEGIKLPRHEGGLHLGVSSVWEIANKPVGIPLKSYQVSQGNYGGKVMYARHREDAFAVRRQFADFLEEIPNEEE
ncbi:hypothetical protein A3A76_02950 [Candidatus Woesebacteria bacterium RIFCSPLOWO2_01_FULL_39_23]|uniref:Uncharacterized protein n=1 Tax=Candidatus Woesebacteria bacterium RIFCSPHIGHO2_01_FULL_40_22 TaxID=1802499 RepID=A0A1F7YLE9_9BACT|nr:MAG: hypothetical protein A2141_01070 [Candidatus Woesebacteria bacterium RBG_16_40_11]OGM27428.1 MAG: hypothetical protein A2628_01355 [Candidatus Woesebacteria bacterium RIFCSPHIGHO2_01_FULL_40_22]OGM36190.1 MAG: hypothetical protein A3E41_01640 [Candidatus Woesebacteria bacterium RIFCSPHIGHO2_12_FULL_38_9]OGM62600.1 MAG: hypothetical protein A3A76_02950 [Candidatus Woesebacteria bacterium RIFCSPLOWO2_01_FULL_39_23]